MTELAQSESQSKLISVAAPSIGKGTRLWRTALVAGQRKEERANAEPRQLVNVDQSTSSKASFRNKDEIINNIRQLIRASYRCPSNWFLLGYAKKFQAGGCFREKSLFQRGESNCVVLAIRSDRFITICARGTPIINNFYANFFEVCPKGASIGGF